MYEITHYMKRHSKFNAPPVEEQVHIMPILNDFNGNISINGMHYPCNIDQIINNIDDEF